MLQLGEEVVLMSQPGRFRIIAIDGPVLTIENVAGVRKQVMDQAVRAVPPRAAAAE